MLNNPNEWHNIQTDPIEENSEDAIEVSEPEVNNVKPMSFFAQNKNLIILFIALILLIVLAAGAYIYKKNKDNEKISNSNAQLANYFYNQASNPNTQSAQEPTTIVEVNLDEPVAQTNAEQYPSAPGNAIPNQQPPIQQNSPPSQMQAGLPQNRQNTVTVRTGDIGRDNPFRPYKNQLSTSKYYNLAYNNLDFDVIEPPQTILEDSAATKLMEITISGIMYDFKSPSAIINIEGQDQLVRKGDRLYGYTILDITREKVVVKTGSNIFRASVGQSIATEDIKINQVSNLKYKFAGPYHPAKKAIEIKSN